MGQQFDITFDFTVESLSRLDGWLAQWIDMTEAYSGDRPEDMLPVAFAVAAYAGEVMRRNFEDTTWVTEPEEGQVPPPHLLVGGKIRVNLMKKAIQILMRTDSPSFAAYFQTITELASEGSPETET
jgi:hypothetical protein